MRTSALIVAACSVVIGATASIERPACKHALTLRGGFGKNKLEINADRLKLPPASEVQSRGEAVRTDVHPVQDTKQAVSNAVSDTKQQVSSAPQKKSLQDTLKLGLYLFLWYFFNVVYNLQNKKLLNAVPLPWSMANAQLGLGLLYLLPVYLFTLRPRPIVSKKNVQDLAPIAVAHTAGHVMTVLSLAAGSVAFTHIVKAAEPLFSTLMSATILKSTFSWQTYATLIPIVVGVGVASVSELSFSWVSFLNAMGSNTAFSLRAILSKKAMDKPQGKNMTPPNLYAVLNTMSFFGLIPFTLAIEGSRIKKSFQHGALNFADGNFWNKFVITGVSYYLYNELAFLALGQVHPITHAVANTIKRVAILVASVIAFKTKMSPQAIGGSSLAVTGTLLYSLAKSRFG
jgi:solute carrier family 35 protein E1